MTVSTRTFLFTGKGGTGKSTLAQSCALSFARARKLTRTLLVDLSLNPHWTQSYEPIQKSTNLWACHITKDACKTEYITRKIKIKKLAAMILSNQTVEAFFDTAPGLEGVLIVGKIWELARSGDYDVVVVDAPATGHGMGMLQTIPLARKLLRVGPIVEECRQIEAWLKGGMVHLQLITLLEEMPVQETLELARALINEKYLIDRIVVNRYPGFLPSFINDDFLSSIKDIQLQIHPLELLLVREFEGMQRHLRDLLQSEFVSYLHKVNELIPPTDGSSPAHAALWDEMKPCGSMT